MATEEVVEQFLKEFHEKAKIFGIHFRDDRQKNSYKSLSLLDITPTDRIKIINKLTAKDFLSGPKKDNINNYVEMWEFGKKINKQDVYIKISVGRIGDQPICISFHKAEYKFNYPFK